MSTACDTRVRNTTESIPSDNRRREQFALQANVVRRLFSVSTCADRSSSRYALESVLLDIGADGSVVSVATNGRHLAWNKAVGQGNLVSAPLSVLIPREVGAKLAALSTSANAVSFDLTQEPDGRTEWRGTISWRQRNGAKIVEVAPVVGRFPDWRSITAAAAALPVKGWIEGRAEDISDSLPKPSTGWFIRGDEGKANWIQESIPVDDSGVNQVGQVDSMLDVDLLSTWIDAQPTKSRIEIQFADGCDMIRGTVDGELGYVLMPMHKTETRKSRKVR